MIVDAITTFTLIVDTAIAWVQALAAAATFVLAVVLFAVGPLVVPAARTVRRAPSWARNTIQARRIARATRPDYEEAA